MIAYPKYSWGRLLHLRDAVLKAVSEKGFQGLGVGAIIQINNSGSQGLESVVV